MAKPYDATKMHFCIAKIFLEARGVITASEIIEKMDVRYGMRCDRKTIYSTLMALDSLVPVECVYAGRNSGFRRHDVMGGCDNG